MWDDISNAPSHIQVNKKHMMVVNNDNNKLEGPSKHLDIMSLFRLKDEKDGVII